MTTDNGRPTTADNGHGVPIEGRPLPSFVPRGPFKGTEARGRGAFLAALRGKSEPGKEALGKGGALLGRHETWRLIAEQRTARNPWLKTWMPPPLKVDAKRKDNGFF